MTQKDRQALATVLAEVASEYQEIDELGTVEKVAVRLVERFGFNSEEFYLDAGLPFLLVKA